MLFSVSCIAEEVRSSWKEFQDPLGFITTSLCAISVLAFGLQHFSAFSHIQLAVMGIINLFHNNH